MQGAQAGGWPSKNGALQRKAIYFKAEREEISIEQKAVCGY